MDFFLAAQFLWIIPFAQAWSIFLTGAFTRASLFSALAAIAALACLGANEALDLDYDGLVEYLHSNHSVYMKVGSAMYYLTDANFQAWRAQDTSKRNHKNHYVDCSDLVPTLDEFLAIPFVNGSKIKDVFPSATFYASVKGEKTE